MCGIPHCTVSRDIPQCQMEHRRTARRKTGSCLGKHKWYLCICCGTSDSTPHILYVEYVLTTGRSANFGCKEGDPSGRMGSDYHYCSYGMHGRMRDNCLLMLDPVNKRVAQACTLRSRLLLFGSNSHCRTHDIQFPCVPLCATPCWEQHTTCFLRTWGSSHCTRKGHQNT